MVPGNASGGMDGIALKPLTVAFHEPGFVSKLNSENQFGPWFTLSDREKQQLGSPMGPANPQVLNRYSYTLNNPVRYTDPSGHTWKLNPRDAAVLANQLRGLASDWNIPGIFAGLLGTAAEIAQIARAGMGIPAVGLAEIGGIAVTIGAPMLIFGGGTAALLADEINNMADLIEKASAGNPEGVLLELRGNVLWATNQETGETYTLKLRYLAAFLPDTLRPGTKRESRT